MSCRPVVPGGQLIAYEISVSVCGSGVVCEGRQSVLKVILVQ